MTVANSPFFDIQYGWDTGASGWGDPVNNNFKVLSFLGKGAVDSFVSTLPTSPSTRDSVVLTGDNQMYFRFSTGWSFLSPENGMELNETSTGNRYKFNGSSWVRIPIARTSGFVQRV